MRVICCVNRFPSTSQTFILTQMKEIQRLGHQVYIYALEHDPAARLHPSLRPEEFCEKVIYAPVLPSSKIARVARAAALWSPSQAGLFRRAWSPSVFGFSQSASMRRLINAADFCRVLDEVAPDVVHVHFAVNAEAPLCCRLAGRMARSRFIVTFHGFDLMPHLPFYKALFREAVLFTVNSDYSRGIAGNQGCPTDRLVKLPMGVDCDVFTRSEPRRENEAPLNILFVGRLVPMKGPDIALKAFGRLLEMTSVPCRLVVIGDGPMRDELQKLSGNLGLRDSVSFRGALSLEDVRAAMERAAIFLLPGVTGPHGREENQGLVIQEAQAMELPVVVSDIGGVTEGVENGRTGFVVSPGDVESVAVALKRLIENDALRVDMGKRGRQLVLEKFNAATLAEALDEIYRL